MQFIDLKKQFEVCRSDIEKNISDVMENTAFIMGPHVTQLEEKLAAFTQTRHAISVSSGTDALLVALMALGVGPGDEVVTSPFSFIAGAETIAFLGATPVFAEIDPDTYNIDPNSLREKITDKTKALMPVDIFGQCADYDEINAIAKEHNLPVIEDAAQSLGAEYKGKPSCSLGDIGCTSFFPAKPLGCYGDGGMVFTDSDELADIIRSIRVHGKGSHKYENVRVGMNGRLDTMQAAVLLGKLNVFNDEIQKRQTVAAIYEKGLSEHVKTPVVSDHNKSVYAQYSILVENDRDGVVSRLKQAGIPSAIYYPKPLHLQTAFSDLGYEAGDFPVTEDVCSRIFAVPMHPYLTPEDQEQIIKAVIAAKG